VAERPAEQAVEGLPAFFAAEVPERLVDPRKGIIARLRAMIPQAGPEVIAGDRLTLPGVATDHEGDGGVSGRLDGGRSGPGGAFAPADEAVVGREADDRVGHPATCDAAADLVVEIGDAHIPCLEANDSHGMAAGAREALGESCRVKD